MQTKLSSKEFHPEVKKLTSQRRTWCSNEETDSGLLNPNEIKSFLKDFLKDHQISETDLDFIVSNMNTDKNGRIDKYEMTAFVLTLTGYEKLVKPRQFEKRLNFS